MKILESASQEHGFVGERAAETRIDLKKNGLRLWTGYDGCQFMKGDDF